MLSVDAVQAKRWIDKIPALKTILDNPHELDPSTPRFTFLAAISTLWHYYKLVSRLSAHFPLTRGSTWNFRKIIWRVSSKESSCSISRRDPFSRLRQDLDLLAAFKILWPSLCSAGTGAIHWAMLPPRFSAATGALLLDTRQTQPIFGSSPSLKAIRFSNTRPMSSNPPLPLSSAQLEQNTRMPAPSDLTVLSLP
jgi:hypothetical protein